MSKVFQCNVCECISGLIALKLSNCYPGMCLDGEHLKYIPSYITYRLGMSGGSNNIGVLQSMGSPLSANGHRLEPDDPIPTPEAGTCPWPTYLCHGTNKYRTFDGSCNNLHNPLWGRSFTPTVRFLPSQYGDGKQLLSLLKSSYIY